MLFALELVAEVTGGVRRGSDFVPFCDVESDDDDCDVVIVERCCTVAVLGRGDDEDDNDGMGGLLTDETGGFE